MEDVVSTSIGKRCLFRAKAPPPICDPLQATPPCCRSSGSPRKSNFTKPILLMSRLVLRTCLGIPYGWRSPLILWPFLLCIRISYLPFFDMSFVVGKLTAWQKNGQKNPVVCDTWLPYRASSLWLILYLLCGIRSARLRNLSPGKSDIWKRASSVHYTICFRIVLCWSRGIGFLGP